MYKVVFEYVSGKKGTCTENGAPRLFETKAEAEAFAADLNSIVEGEDRDFFPTWYVKEA